MGPRRSVPRGLPVFGEILGRKRPGGFNLNSATKTVRIRTLSKIAMLGVVSFILMFFKAPLPFAPSFMKFDVSDLPSLLGAFAMGPVAGVAIQFVKNVLNVVFEGTVTGGVGEMSNFLVGSVFVLTAGSVYAKGKSFKRAVLGLVLGVGAMTLFATVNNYYIMFPVFAKAFGLPLDTIISMGKKVNPYVVDYKTLMIFAVVPFNLLKGTAASVVTVLVYKRLSPMLHK